MPGERIGGTFGRIDDLKRHTAVDFIDRLKGERKADCGFALDHHFDRPGTGFRELLEIAVQLINIGESFFFAPNVYPVFIEKITGAAGLGIRHGDQIAVLRVQQVFVGLGNGQSVFFQRLGVDDNGAGPAVPKSPTCCRCLQA